MAAGLALTSSDAIAEIMFGDFIALAFDQILNFAGKSVHMYGRTHPVPLIVRCPTGAGRGYGPTHSQSLQKHSLGIPGLSVPEVSPFHDNRVLLPQILHRAAPAVLFEDKILYTRQIIEPGAVDGLFVLDLPPEAPGFARVCLEPGRCDCVLIAPGGVAHPALAAMKELLLEADVACQLFVLSQLYPLDLTPLLATLATARRVCVVEDGTPVPAEWGQSGVRGVS